MVKLLYKERIYEAYRGKRKYSSNLGKRQGSSGTKVCTRHGIGSHSTEECRALKKPRSYSTEDKPKWSKRQPCRIGGSPDHWKNECPSRGRKFGNMSLQVSKDSHEEEGANGAQTL